VASIRVHHLQVRRERPAAPADDREHDSPPVRRPRRIPIVVLGIAAQLTAPGAVGPAQRRLGNGVSSGSASTQRRRGGRPTTKKGGGSLRVRASDAEASGRRPRRCRSRYHLLVEAPGRKRSSPCRATTPAARRGWASHQRARLRRGEVQRPDAAGDTVVARECEAPAVRRPRRKVVVRALVRHAPEAAPSCLISQMSVPFPQPSGPQRENAICPAVEDAPARRQTSGRPQRARLRSDRSSASGTAADSLEGADYVLPVPKPPLPLLTPILSIVPRQLFAWALARAKGLDPDSPAGLSKVTLAL
jgi:hypothetical protein